MTLASQPFIPLAPPLLQGHADPLCQAIVIIPARNEEAAIARALDALRLQSDVDGTPLSSRSYEVLLLLNNCTDSSVQIAEQYQKEHPSFVLHVISRTLERSKAHVGTARRMLMDTAHHRLMRSAGRRAAILSTDADSVVAPDWIARNLAILETGADAVGGVIHLFPDELDELKTQAPDVFLAYNRDRQLQRLVAHLEGILDPDPADPLPRHLEHFGASLACTAEIYARAGGMPPVKPLEDVAFVGELRKIGARIRHAPEVKIYTSARLSGRAEVGLSGQLSIWQQQANDGERHMVDSAAWFEHRFRSLAALRCLNESKTLPSLTTYPDHWCQRIASLHQQHLPVPRFLEELDCDALIEELFLAQEAPRRDEITEVLADLSKRVEALDRSPDQ
jgi:GT2 family glycosyltransferase